MAKILLTGATGRVGTATVKRLAPAGHQFALIGRQSKKLDRIVRELGGGKATGHAIAIDLTNPNSAEIAIDRATRAMDGLDILVNNAAAFGFAPFKEAEAEHIDKLIDTNLRAVLHLTAAALTPLAHSSGAAIINVASTAGRTPVPEAALYSATKAALIAFGQAFRDEAAALGISFCTLIPGQLRLSDDPNDSGLEPAVVAEAIAGIVDDPAPGKWPVEILL